MGQELQGALECPSLECPGRAEVALSALGLGQGGGGHSLDLVIWEGFCNQNDSGILCWFSCISDGSDLAFQNAP